MAEAESPAEVYERYLGRAIADPFTHVLLDCAGPKARRERSRPAAGTGSVARHVAPLVGVEGRVVAVVINSPCWPSGALFPHRPGLPIAWREGDAVRPDLPDQAFDRGAALREIRRVLQPEGRTVVSVWQDIDRHSVYKALFEATARKLQTNVSDFDVSLSLGDAGARALFQEGGFARVEMTARSLDIRLPRRNASCSSRWPGRPPPCLYADEPESSLRAGRGYRRRA